LIAFESSNLGLVADASVDVGDDDAVLFLPLEVDDDIF
jgi:hypothetical protein